MSCGATDSQLFRGALATLRRDHGPAGRATVERSCRARSVCGRSSSILVAGLSAGVALKTLGPANRFPPAGEVLASVFCSLGSERFFEPCEITDKCVNVGG